jgi:heat shock protein HtpX
MKAADITSTHPPISERIRILRTMAGGSFKDYDNAYRTVKKGTGVMPGSALFAAEAVTLRGASTTEKKEAQDEVKRARETSNAMWRLNKYNTVDCQCGTKFRIPPGFKAKEFICPHCGHLNKVP